MVKFFRRKVHNIDVYEMEGVVVAINDFQPDINLGGEIRTFSCVIKEHNAIVYKDLEVGMKVKIVIRNGYNFSLIKLNYNVKT